MIKLTVIYAQDFCGETLEDTYTGYYPDGINIELEKHRIREILLSDSDVRYVYIKEERIKKGEN